MYRNKISITIYIRNENCYRCCRRYKQNITDNQYKTLMDSLMEINNNGNKLPLLTNHHKLNKFICLFNWLDTKLKITDHKYDSIKKQI
jgi:hypothetical protein